VTPGQRIPQSASAQSEGSMVIFAAGITKDFTGLHDLHANRR
jgi:hypothetical protein